MLTQFVKSKQERPVVFNLKDGGNIRKSFHHEGMWIINCADGKWYNMSASEEQIKQQFKSRMV